MPSTKRACLLALRLLGVILALSLFARVLAGADGQRVATLVLSVGAFGFVALLLPQLCALGLEALGWKLSFRVLGREVAFLALLRVRLSTEALAQSLPLGVAFAESLKPLLLKRHAGLPASESVAGMAARKYLLLLAQSLYVIALGALGFAGLEAASRATIGTGGLGVLTVVTGGVFGLMALGLALLLRQSGVARAAFSLLRRVPLSRWRDALARRQRAFAAADSAVSRYFQAPLRRSLPPAAFFLGAWFVESIETYLIFRALGVEASFVTLASLEVVLCIVRNVAFVVPAGLGVQDLGYVALLTALGVPDAASTGTAFVLMKRAKELFWIAAGYALLAADFATGAESGAGWLGSLRAKALSRRVKRMPDARRVLGPGW